MLFYIFSAIIGYLIGSIPVGYLLVKFVYQKDIREFGSGNFGATNIWRAGYKNIAIMTFALDAFKALFSIFIAKQIGIIFDVQKHHIHNGEIIAGFFSVIGHMFSIYFRGKGGKGVATMIGYNLYLSLTMSILGLALWYGIFRFTRYSSLSSLAFVGFNLLYGLIFIPGLAKLAIIILSGLIIYQHRENIRRLLNNEESKL